MVNTHVTKEIIIRTHMLLKRQSNKFVLDNLMVSFFQTNGSSSSIWWKRGEYVWNFPPCFFKKTTDSVHFLCCYSIYHLFFFSFHFLYRFFFVLRIWWLNIFIPVALLLMKIDTCFLFWIKTKKKITFKSMPNNHVDHYHL